MEQNFIENELIILTKQTLDEFFKQENAADLISLYVFYYYTAKWQKTNQIKATTEYTSKGIGMGLGNVRKVKKQLIELGLIEDVEKKDELGKITGHYIKVNYIFKKQTENNTHPNEKPQGGETHSVGNRETNALSINNINALSSNNEKENILKEIFDFWNSKASNKHRVLSEEIKKSISKAIKLYGVDKLKVYIERYTKVVNDKRYFFDYKWGLKDLLDRKNGISSFTDEGSKWIDYCNKVGIKANANQEEKQIKVDNNGVFSI